MIQNEENSHSHYCLFSYLGLFFFLPHLELLNYGSKHLGSICRYQYYIFLNVKDDTLN